MEHEHAIPSADSAGSDQPASPEKQERVEDRPNVSPVTPEDYPPDERAGGTPDPKREGAR